MYRRGTEKRITSSAALTLVTCRRPWHEEERDSPTFSRHERSTTRGKGGGGEDDDEDSSAGSWESPRPRLSTGSNEGNELGAPPSVFTSSLFSSSFSVSVNAPPARPHGGGEEEDDEEDEEDEEPDEDACRLAEERDVLVLLLVLVAPPNGWGGGREEDAAAGVAVSARGREDPAPPPLEEDRVARQ